MLKTKILVTSIVPEMIRTPMYFLRYTKYRTILTIFDTAERYQPHYACLNNEIRNRKLNLFSGIYIITGIIKGQLRFH